MYLLLGIKNSPYSIEEDMKRGLKKNEFIPYAQTIACSKSNKIIGLEILMRWQHPVNGLVRPDLFIPQSEANGLIIPMTYAIMKETSRLISKHKSNLPDDFHIGINITPAHCEKIELLDNCLAFLRETDNKIRLVLELTERQPLTLSEKNKNLFLKMHQRNIYLAIDDFGTGHSSLGYLQHLKVNYIKIDKSFVSQIGENSISEHLIDNIIELANKLSLKVIAEGVETQTQADNLKDRGVEYFQGYLYNKPQPLENILNGIVVTKSKLS